MNVIEDLGRVEYGASRRLMDEEAESILSGDSSGKLFLVEHDPVFTAGRATPESDLFDGVVPIERGGQITWHGPGQLVIYPVLRLQRRDVRRWLRAIEAFGVGMCRHFDLEAIPSVDGTGVFVEDRKVASIGVAVKRWISIHGIAINVDVDMAAFHSIRPCGLSPDVMTDLSRECRRAVSLDEARAAARTTAGILFEEAASCRDSER